MLFTIYHHTYPQIHAMRWWVNRTLGEQRDMPDFGDDSAGLQNKSRIFCASTSELALTFWCAASVMHKQCPRWPGFLLWSERWMRGHLWWCRISCGFQSPATAPFSAQPCWKWTDWHFDSARSYLSCSDLEGGAGCVAPLVLFWPRHPPQFQLRDVDFPEWRIFQGLVHRRYFGISIDLRALASCCAVIDAILWFFKFQIVKYFEWDLIFYSNSIQLFL